MKKFLTYASIISCAIGAIATTAASIIFGTAGAVLLYGGIGVGLLGIGAACVVAKMEDNEYKQKQIIEPTEYKSEQSELKTTSKKVLSEEKTVVSKTSNTDLTK